jgi:VanZ family protein
MTSRTLPYAGKARAGEHRAQRLDVPLSIFRHHMRTGTRVLLVIAALIVYGSLYPFTLSVPDSAALALAVMFDDWSFRTSIGDALGNLALFVPFGIAGGFAFSSQAMVKRSVIVLGMSFFLALGVQLAQIYFPPRTPAIVDIAWNLLGAGAGLAMMSSLRHYAMPLAGSWGFGHKAAASILALWLATELAPFVPSLDMQLLKNTAKALLQLRLSPVQILWHASGVLVAARALRMLAPGDRAYRTLLVLIAVVLAGKVIVAGREPNVSTIAGFMLGYAVAYFVRNHLHRADPLVLAALLAAYTLRALQPFQLQMHPVHFSWIPFAAMLQGSMSVNVQVLIESTFLFTAVLGLIRTQGMGVGPSTAVLALWVAALEFAQMYIPGRSPDITEPLLVLLIGLLLKHADERRDRPQTAGARALQ